MADLKPLWAKDPLASLLAHAASSGMGDHAALESLEPDAPQRVYDEIVQALRQESISAADFTQIVQDYKKGCSQRSFLPSCASCGLRSSADCATYELDQLPMLRLTGEDLVLYNEQSNTQRLARSVYGRRNDNGTNGDAFHVHPELVSNKDGKETVLICAGACAFDMSASLVCV